MMHKMQLSRRHKKLLAFALLILMLGFINYYLFVPRLYLFRLIPLPPEKTYYIPNTFIRQLMTGYFSDACWCCALYLVTAILAELNYLQITGKIIILSLPFCIEFAQYFKLIPGIFDWFDLLTYGIILVVFLKIFQVLKPTRHEKV